MQALERELHQTNENLAEKVTILLATLGQWTPVQTLLICEMAGLPPAVSNIT